MSSGRRDSTVPHDPAQANQESLLLTLHLKISGPVIGATTDEHGSPTYDGISGMLPVRYALDVANPIDKYLALGGW
jgi:hypothetical protein